MSLSPAKRSCSSKLPAAADPTMQPMLPALSVPQDQSTMTANAPSVPQVVSTNLHVMSPPAQPVPMNPHAIVPVQNPHLTMPQWGYHDAPQGQSTPSDTGVPALPYYQGYYGQPMQFAPGPYPGHPMYAPSHLAPPSHLHPPPHVQGHTSSGDSQSGGL